MKLVDLIAVIVGSQTGALVLAICVITSIIVKVAQLFVGTEIYGTSSNICFITLLVITVTSRACFYSTTFHMWSSS